MLLDAQRNLIEKIQAPFRRDADAFNQEMIDTNQIRTNSLSMQLDDVEAKIREAKYYA